MNGIYLCGESSHNMFGGGNKETTTALLGWIGYNRKNNYRDPSLIAQDDEVRHAKAQKKPGPRSGLLI